MRVPVDRLGWSAMTAPDGGGMASDLSRKDSSMSDDAAAHRYHPGDYVKLAGGDFGDDYPSIVVDIVTDPQREAEIRAEDDGALPPGPLYLINDGVVEDQDLYHKWAAESELLPYINFDDLEKGTTTT